MTAKFGSTKPYTNKDKNNLEFPGKLQVSNETSSLHGKSRDYVLYTPLSGGKFCVCFRLSARKERKGSNIMTHRESC